MVGGEKHGDFADESKLVSFIGSFNEFNDVIGKNCIYVCLDKSEEHFARRAVEHGALAVISEWKIANLPCIVVKDAWDALVKISAMYYSKNFNASTTVVAGSIGKTTTKEMIEAVYSRQYRAFSTPNNGNVMRYLAYEIQHMPGNVQQFVQEVDESYPNNASYCSETLKPEIAVITTIDKSHIGALGSEDDVMRSITAVTDYMPDTGHVIISADDPKSMECTFRQNVHTVAIENKDADCVASDIVLNTESVDFTVTYNKETARVHLNCPGRHNIYNAMFAFVAGKLKGISTKRILRGLAKYRPMTIRQKIYRWQGRTLYVDCYNASAKSISAALKVVGKLKPARNGRRIAVIGDVAEIEGYETQTYKEVAESIESEKIDTLISYGESSAEIWKLLTREIDGCHIKEEKELLDYLNKNIRKGDVALFKASHCMNLEHVVRSLYPVAVFFGKIRYWAKLSKYLVKTI